MGHPPPGKEPQLADVFAESKENVVMVVVMEEGSYKYQLRPRDQLQKQGLLLSELFVPYFVKYVCVQNFCFLLPLVFLTFSP